MYNEENNDILKRNLEVFKSEDSEEAKKRRNTVCVKCVYRCGDREYDRNGNEIPYTGGCAYIFVNGVIRPCAPSECVEKGVFKEGKRLNVPRNRPRCAKIS